MPVLKTRMNGFYIMGVRKEDFCGNHTFMRNSGLVSIRNFIHVKIIDFTVFCAIHAYQKLLLP